MEHRRDFFYRIGTYVLGGIGGLVLAVPGVAYVLSPILNKSGAGGSPGAEGEGTYHDLARLSELPVGVPRSFPVRAERVDAWVKYPEEPVGTVWLIRQPEGEKEPVVAFTAECPHLGCGVNLAADKSSFACPCHNSAFRLDGTPENEIPPRPMDSLKVRLTNDTDPRISVQFERFRAQTKEKIPLA